MNYFRLMTIIGCFLGISISGYGAEPITPEIKTLLKNVYDTAHQVQSASLEVRKEMEIVYTKKNETKETQEKEQILYVVALDQPNKFYIFQDNNNAVLASDGKKLDFYIPDMEAYVEKEAPKDFAGIVGFIKNEPIAVPFLLAFQETTSLADIFSTEPFEESLKEFEKVTLIGEETIKGSVCQKICIEIEKQIHTLWVDKGAKPVIRKAVVDYRKAVEEKAKKNGDVIRKYEVSVLFTGWDAKEKISPEQFVFSPPANAKQLSSFDDINKEPDHPLEGKPAIDFTLKKLDGSNFTLSELKGKKVVILDFWATWCPPCQRSMPILEKVMEGYKDKDVLLIAVNEQETPKAINAFLEKKGLHPTVVLDEKGDVGTKYQANAIPQFVIIGKDGVIKKVFPGVPPSFESTFQKIIDAELK